MAAASSTPPPRREPIHRDEFFPEEEQEDEEFDQQKYNDDLDALLNGSSSSNTHDNANGEQGQIAEQEEESFLYPGADPRPDFLQNGSSSNDDGSDGQLDNDEAYAAKMSSILGPDDDSEEGEQAESQSIAADTSIATLPDRTRDNYTPSITSTTSPSIRSSQQHQRPPEYPRLSRLRASHKKFDRLTSLTSSSYSSRFDSPVSNNSTLHSRLHSRSTSTSISGSLSSSPFPYPYGSNLELPKTAPTHDHTQRDGGSSSNQEAVAAVEHDILRWSALRRTGLFFARTRNGKSSSESGSVSANSGQKLPENIGRQTAFAVGNGLVAIGTSSGVTLLFEFSQELKCICGDGNNDTALSGRVTSLAFSSDSTSIAIGHAQGQIYLYDLNKPTSPSRSISPLTSSEVKSGKKEGHLTGSKILHLSFVGTRHTAIYSSDENGLCFYHSLGKIIGVASNDTLRVLGRYPHSQKSETLPVLDMKALPLGPIRHDSDSNHFLAIITAKKLVVVALKPNARTWYRKIAPVADQEQHAGKSGQMNADLDMFDEEEQGLVNGNGRRNSQMNADLDTLDEEQEEGQDWLDTSQSQSQSRPSETPASHSPHSCCSWFPAFQAEEPSSTTDANGFVPPRLAFSFGSQLFLLHLSTRQVTDRIPSNDGSYTTRTRRELVFSEHGLACDKTEINACAPIQGIQWLSHEFLLLLNPTHVLLYDLRRGQITEKESIRPTLNGLINQTWSTSAQRGHILTGSMRAHQGKAFFLTAQQIIVGHPSTWADRILALVSQGDFLSAIQLTTSYYKGTIPGSCIGLPEDVNASRQQVGKKLSELMSASARYAFSPDRLIDNTHVSADGRGVDRMELFQNLTRVCAEASIALEDYHFLFEDLYEYYLDNGIDSIFIQEIEPFLLDRSLSTTDSEGGIPLPVTQAIIKSCAEKKDLDKIEKIIINYPYQLDLDQVLKICLNKSLYSSLIFIYNSVLQDFVAPIVELLPQITSADQVAPEVYIIYSYLSVILSGQSYPSQENLSEAMARKAKSSLYAFIFSGHCIVWPPNGGGKLVLTVGDDQDEPTYPYLRLLLRFDPEALLDTMDVAFEDSYLDDDDDDEEQGDKAAPNVLTRQRIVDILVEITPALQPHTDKRFDSDLEGDETLFTAIFIARNAPKYPQFIHLSGTTVHQILTCLTRNDWGTDTREDRQLACESLLSVHKIDLTDDILAMFDHAGFWRILQRAYRSTGKWGQLIAMILNDLEQQQEDSPSSEGGTFSQLTQVLQKAISPKSAAASSDLDLMIFEAVPVLIKSDTYQTAQLIDRFYPSRHVEALEMLQDEEMEQLAYLQCFFPRSEEHMQSWAGSHDVVADPSLLDRSHLSTQEREEYLDLTAKLNPTELVRQLDQSEAAYFNVDKVIECGHRHDCPDAVLWALNQQGSSLKAFDALDKIIAGKASELKSGQDTIEIARRLRGAMNMAVKICQSRRQSSAAHTRADEMWFRLLRSCINLLYHLQADETCRQGMQTGQEIVSETISQMITSITSTEIISFPKLFRRLVNDDDDHHHNYNEVKIILNTIMNSCKLQCDLLEITNQLYSQEVFHQFSQLNKVGKRGWRAVPSAFVGENGLENANRDLSEHRSPSTPSQRKSSTSIQSPTPSTSTSTMLLSRSRSQSLSTTPTPSRGIDFLSIQTTPTTTTITPRVDKGKGRDRSLDSEYQRRKQAQIGSSFSAGGGGDYFGPSIADPTDGFLSVPVEQSQQQQKQDTDQRDQKRNDVQGAPQAENTEGSSSTTSVEDHYLFPRRPISVRLGRVQ
ncbi:unnamed protein product [Sympodiomycopsis kandeliae]